MKSPHIVVVGSLNMDIVIQADRTPLMGETILGNQAQFISGGKGANQAVAAARLGARTSLIGAVGNDSFGQELLQAMEQNGISRESILISDKQTTGIASIYLTQQDNSIIVVPGANATLLPQHIDACAHILREADILLIQLEIPLETAAYAAQLAKTFGKIVVLNPAPAQPLPSSMLEAIDLMTPNQSELNLLAGLSSESEDLKGAIRTLMNQGVSQVITTLGKNGCAFMEEDTLHHIPSYPVSVVDTTGAGDAFNAGLAYAVACGHSLREATRFASSVAALAVTQFGAQAGMPSMDEVRQFMTSSS